MSQSIEPNAVSKSHPNPTSYRCRKCNLELAKSDDFLSGNFRGQHGKAKLFGGVSNLDLDKPVERTMTTGLHVIQDVHCQQCKEYVGWKYKEAPESQKYKEGKYLLEIELLSELEMMTCPMTYGCKNCGVELAESDDCMSRNFRGVHGEAQLFAKAANLDLGEPIDRHMTTGLNVIQLAHCRQCKACVGWRYRNAVIESEKYKEGKYLLEMQLMVEKESKIGPML